jgi:hypothetical protein
VVAPAQIYKQISAITADLIGLSLCDHQNFPTLTQVSARQTEISFSGAANLGVVLKNVSYEVIYEELKRTKSYNLKMIDGALIQIMYKFLDEKIAAHRLAFFPSPDLLEYQNNPGIYELDEIYAEVIMKNVVTLPIRFDFDVSDEIFIELHHPKSHLTLGQYSNCRIPVSGPITPSIFMDFILRNFYNTAHRKFCGEMSRFEDIFDSTITKIENEVMHVKVSSS